MLSFLIPSLLMLRGVLKYDPGETDLGFNLSQQVTTPVVCERTAKVRV